jgi:hypothetical protein
MCVVVCQKSKAEKNIHYLVLFPESRERKRYACVCISKFFVVGRSVEILWYHLV